MSWPDFAYEEKLWENGHRCVAGTDEVGRGCFAGPLVTASVVFAPDTIVPDGLINDSKKLSNKKRRKADVWIRENATAWGVGEISVSAINRMGIGKATASGFRRSIASAQKITRARISFLLVDAFYIPYTRGFPTRQKNMNLSKLFQHDTGQLAIKKGDAKSLSIAAASIIAKVYRDDLMEKLGAKTRYIKYGWQDNKGYGTKKHRDAILIHGATNHHRKQFVETFLSNFASSRVG